MRALSRYSGSLMIATGVVHTVYGVRAFTKPLAAIHKAGYLNAVDPDRDRQLAFWFLLSGASMMVTGQLARWAHRETGDLPAALGWNMLVMSGVGVVLMPASGFWLFIPQALIVLSASRGKVTEAGAVRIG